MVAKTWKQKSAGSRHFCTTWLCLSFIVLYWFLFVLVLSGHLLCSCIQLFKITYTASSCARLSKSSAMLSALTVLLTFLWTNEYCSCAFNFCAYVRLLFTVDFFSLYARATFLKSLVKSNLYAREKNATSNHQLVHIRGAFVGWIFLLIPIVQHDFPGRWFFFVLIVATWFHMVQVMKCRTCSSPALPA